MQTHSAGAGMNVIKMLYVFSNSGSFAGELGGWTKPTLMHIVPRTVMERREEMRPTKKGCVIEGAKIPAPTLTSFSRE